MRIVIMSSSFDFSGVKKGNGARGLPQAEREAKADKDAKALIKHLLL